MSNPLSFYGNPVPVKGYQNFSGTGVGLCTPPRGVPTCVPVVIKWSDYINAIGSAAPAVPVSMNLQAGGNAGNAPIDRIRSIKIDNTGGFSAVTVFFPDTQDTVTCSQDSETFANVLTGGLQAIAYMQIQTGNIGRQTTIFFNNFMLDAAEIQNTTVTENTELATGAPFSLSNTGIPSIGDRTQLGEIDLSLTGVASQLSLFGGPADGYNFVRLKEMRLQTRGNYSDTFAYGSLNASIVDDNASTFFTFPWHTRNDLDDYSRGVIPCDVDGMEFPLSSQIGSGHANSRKYFLQNNVASTGHLMIRLVYTLVNVVNF